MKSLRIIPALLCLLLVHCGAGAPILVEVDDQKDGAGDDTDAMEAPGGIARRLAQDARLAFDVIGEIISGGDPNLAALGASYSLRLGLKHDAPSVVSALQKGTESGNVLIVALSWRWLINMPSTTVASAAQSSDDPVASLFATLYKLTWKQDVKFDQSPFLFCPEADGHVPRATGEFQTRTTELLSLARPFDRGALALASAMIESQRYGWSEQTGDGQVVFSCHRLRELLFDTIELNPDVAGKIKAHRPKTIGTGRSEVPYLLENPMSGAPLASLRGAALTGTNEVRITALRAMDMVVTTPEAEDFGVAAANLKSNDPAVRLEAARTFLHMVALGQKNQ